MAGNKDDVWVVDSGCTEYITHKSNLLDNKKGASNEAPVVIPNGHAIPIEGKGDFILPGGAKINGVLHIPNFKHNLYSVSRIRNDLQCGLYLMDMFEKGRRAMMTTTDTWHQRLGHASRDKLSNVNFLKNNSSKLSNVFCDSCAKAKHVRNPFPKGFIKTNGCFELIHCDIWGGYRIPSYTRANFFLTIVDDYSRVVERKHKHLLETARALRFEANISKRFWGECILTAAYIINRLPSKVIKNKTPYELVLNEEPKYEDLRSFGCLAYFKNTISKGDKYEEKGKPGVFWDTRKEQRDIKFTTLKVKKIVVSRDMLFLEENFLFKNIAGSLDCNKNKPTNVHDDFKSTNFFLDSGEQSCFDGPPHNPSSTTTEDIVSEEENVAQHENDLVENNSLVLGPEIKEDHAISHKEPEPRSKRVRTQPTHLSEYVVNLPPSVTNSQPGSNQANSTVHTISHFVSYDTFYHSHKAFLTTLSSNHEPSYFEQATQDEKWRNAMQQEIKALEKNMTWTLEELPEGKRPIDSKWVYKTKFKSNGEVERYKARLVAKGCTQREGVDYHETFASVAKLVTIRTLLAVATKIGWIIHQLDVNNALLHGYLDKQVYMKTPKGFSKEGETRVCLLQKYLYGLKQASKNWYKNLTSFLLSLNFEQSKTDYSLFTYQKVGVYVAILIYVDDVIIVRDNSKKIQQIKQQLDDEFSIKNLGPLKYFLGIEVSKMSDGLVLSQRKYILDILKDSGMLGCRPSAFPFEQGTKLDKGEEEARVDATQYRRLVERVLYLHATRPDVTYAVNVLSQFVSDPRQNHLEAAKRVLSYLKGTPGQGILLPRKGPTTLTAYCDLDWLGCPFTRRSRTGYLLLFSGGPIS
nr:retrovirus-related Pol polyprotein from transposon TNT 1-94 [Tanacetum cinerariifolium]